MRTRRRRGVSSGNVATPCIYAIDDQCSRPRSQSSATETAAEIYRGISFLMGGDRDYYWKLLEELHNDYLSGNDRYPKSLDEAYTLMSDRNHNPHIYGGSGVGGVTSTQESHSLK